MIMKKKMKITLIGEFEIEEIQEIESPSTSTSTTTFIPLTSSTTSSTTSTTTTTINNSPVIPPVEGDRKFVNIQSEWDSQINDPNVHEIIIDKDSHVTLISTYKIDRDLKIIIREGKVLKVGIDYYDRWTNSYNQPSYLFDVRNTEFIIDGHICQGPQIKNSIEPVRINLFYTYPDPSLKWTIILMNCDSTKLGRNGGIGLGFLYGGLRENHIAAINVKHAGGMFMDAKAAIGGSSNTVLGVTLNKVSTDYENEAEFGSWKVKVEGKVEDGNFVITSNDNTNQIRNTFFSDTGVGNYAYIIHIGRYTFMIKPSNVIDLKTIKLYPIAHGKRSIRIFNSKVYTIGSEGHAGDTFTLNGKTFTCIEKGRDDYPYWTNAQNNPDMNDIRYIPFLKTDIPLPAEGYYEVEWNSSIKDLSFSQPAYLLYKESSYGFHTYPNTKFENPTVMSGGVVGHDMYNHAKITLWAKDVVQRGYYRQTNPGGMCLGYNMVNCTGFKQQFNPPVPVTNDPNLPMPKRITDLLNKY